MEEEKAMKTAGEERKIVVAVDESEESMHALNWCFTNLLAENNHARTTLYLLYVKPPAPPFSSIDAAGYLFSHDVVGKIENHNRELVHSVMKRAESVYGNFTVAAANNNIRVEKKVAMGDAKAKICLAVEKLNADVLVMGSHDYGFFKRALLGSVSDYCAKHVKCPVVVVKRPNSP